MLTAAAAILGMIPIMHDVFWGPMAYAIVGGLAVATALTLVFLPALYVTVNGIREPGEATGGGLDPAGRSCSPALTSGGGAAAPPRSPPAIGPDHVRTSEVSRLCRQHAARRWRSARLVRFYDTKAQIVGVGYILALNVVLHFGDLLPNHAPIGPLFFAAVWLIVIMPIVQFGQVLYPSRRRADRGSWRKRPAAPFTRTSITSIPTVRQCRRIRRASPQVRLDLGRRCRAPQDLSRQDHQAGALSSRPDDDRRFLRCPRGRAVFRSLAVVG